MSMNVGTMQYDQSFYDMVKKDFEKISKMPTAKAETLEDLRDTVGKTFKTADLEKLMEKYDPDAYAEYSKFAKSPDGARSHAGLSYLSSWIDKVKSNLNSEAATIDKTNNTSKTNESKLSEKAQEFLKNLRKQYGNFDFFIGNSTDDLKALAKSGSKEFSVIFSSAEIERMANDEKYAKEKMQSVEGAVRMSKKICEEYGFVSAFGNKEGQNGIINKISITVNDDGSMKIFAELEKLSDKQRERIEQAREKRTEEKKTDRKNPYEKDDKTSVKRTTIEAAGLEEFLEKLRSLNWNNVAEAHSGDRFNFMA